MCNIYKRSTWVLASNISWIDINVYQQIKMHVQARWSWVYIASLWRDPHVAGIENLWVTWSMAVDSFGSDATWAIPRWIEIYQDACLNKTHKQICIYIYVCTYSYIIKMFSLSKTHAFWMHCGLCIFLGLPHICSPARFYQNAKHKDATTVHW